jgi:hypothetical protein
VSAPSFPKLVTTVLLFSAFFGLYNGAMVATLTEMMPARVRTAGFSLAFSLATALFGGLTPLVSTALIQATGNRASPALWRDALHAYDPPRAAQRLELCPLPRIAVTACEARLSRSCLRGSGGQSKEPT